MSDVILRAEGLVRKLEGEIPVTLVDGATLEVNRGEFVAITGPSGSGKSSLLYLLGLLDKPTSGKLFVDGENVAEYNDDQVAAVRLAHIGFVFQFHFLLPEFTALENVMLPMQRLGKLSDKQMCERAASLLADLGLADQTHKIPRQLSGGQCQRVAIARALANEPSIILADEPTGNLDSSSSVTVQNILKDLAHNRNCSVIAVSHEVRFAEEADRRIVIVDGKIQK